jgi:hypothetical protein
MANLYATDGRCHNAELGTYGHECGKPAVWVGRKMAPACPGLGLPKPYPFECGFCEDCRREGYEARAYSDWRRV